jgi:NAD(P)-dependent dehydrogenase (short-subunit alcohol dehydrogenase family)
MRHYVGPPPASDQGLDLAMTPRSPVTESLDGARVVVTGATSGLGRAMAEALAAAGARVGVTSRSRERAEATARELGPAVVGFELDVRDERSVAVCVADVSIFGGADVIRQALAGGYVDELAISTAPLVLGGGKRLFDGFEHDVELEVQRVYTSPYATHVRYRVKR